MALYSCIGFGGGFAGTLLFGVALDQFGGAARSQRGWQLSPPAVSPAWRVASRLPFCCAGNHHLAQLRECEAPSNTSGHKF